MRGRMIREESVLPENKLTAKNYMNREHAEHGVHTIYMCIGNGEESDGRLCDYRRKKSFG